MFTVHCKALPLLNTSFCIPFSYFIIVYYKKSFNDVATEEEFWQYLQGPFLGNLFPDDCYNDPAGNAPNKTNCGGILNFNTKIVSGVRFRQIRAAPMADGERRGDLGACVTVIHSI